MQTYVAKYRGKQVPDSMWPVPCYDDEIYNENISASCLAVAVALAYQDNSYSELLEVKELSSGEVWRE